MAMTYSAGDAVALHTAYASAGRAMSSGRIGGSMDFTDDERRQAIGAESKKNNKK